MGFGERRPGGLFLWGETAVRDNMFIPILLNGVIEDHYWSYSLIPVYENGGIAGVYDAYRNTTEIVDGGAETSRERSEAEAGDRGCGAGYLRVGPAEDRASWENDRMYEIFGRTRRRWPCQR